MSKKGIYITKLEEIKAEYNLFGATDVIEHLRQYPKINSKTRHVISMYINSGGQLSVLWDNPEVIKDLTDITK